MSDFFKDDYSNNNYTYPNCSLEALLDFLYFSNNVCNRVICKSTDKAPPCFDHRIVSVQFCSIDLVEKDLISRRIRVEHAANPIILKPKLAKLENWERFAVETDHIIAHSV